MSTIAIIGGGNIGEALTAGFVAAGRDPSSIVVTNRTPSRSEYLEQTYGVRTTDDNAAAVDGAEFIFVCVKPPYIVETLREVADPIGRNESSTVVSMAAGVTLESMEGALAAGTPVIRVMPNTPMLVGKGMNACASGRYVTDPQYEAVAELLRTVGKVVAVQESQMDAVTALSGSAPAYFYLVTEALIDAGVQLGLKRELASELASTAAAGAGAMLETGEDPAQLRINVSSPSGTTVAALRELEESGIRGAFFRAAEACAQRSADLG